MLSHLVSLLSTQSSKFSKTSTMSAIVMFQHGDKRVLKLNNSFPQPIPKSMDSNEVIVQVAAAGLNPVDFKLRNGPMNSFILPKPKILGADVSGVITYASKKSKFKIGDRVFGLLPRIGSMYGSYAEYVRVEDSHLTLAPSNISLKDAASLPLVGSTVMQAMEPVIKGFNNDTKGKKCFISAGSGGVGTFAIQYCARVLGMYVTTTCSPQNAQLMKDLGASETIDYHTEDIEDKVNNYDVYIDTLSYLYESTVLNSTSKILRRDSKQPSYYIHIASSPYGGSTSGKYNKTVKTDVLSLSIADVRYDRVILAQMKKIYYNLIAPYFQKVSSQFVSLPVIKNMVNDKLRLKIDSMAGIRYHYVIVRTNTHDLDNLSFLLATKQVRPIIQKYLSFSSEEIQTGHELLEEGHVVGKLVMVVNENLL